MGLSKTYQPNEHEAKIYQLWEKGRAFEPKNRGNDGYYSIVMPPPNANANLHIGYALTAVLEDIPVRFHRMQGKASLLLPGADHAGFETQVVYEKHLAKAGKSRFDFTREELYDQVWDFVAQNKQNFETQFRQMGVSCDWSKFTFTLDDKIVERAYKTFKKMWDEGLIYRGERLVNFCTFHGTGFADIEVEHKESSGHLWHIDYPLTDGSGKITVATTRPETMLGDTAVAVHPEDKRYVKFVGKTITLPLTKREIPILADAMVEKEFGSGAVKITPAHDQNDYEVAGRHDLPMISVIGPDGLMTHEAGKRYYKLPVKEARKKVIQDLKDGGLLAKTDDYGHSVGHCYKCGTVIEPLLREQWFVNMQPLSEKAIQALEKKQIKFYPDNKREQLIAYLKGLRDWNISRQIAWGIPIPAFQNVHDPEDWIFDTNVKKEFIKKDGKTYHRDPDVFDTWFSSSSWPYATLDYPESADFKKFYPLSLMETGGEILQPWVSRMIMLGLYITGEVPFKEVYIHGYVMASDGSKMSKSIGNVVDPLPVIEKYGSDALRMGLIANRTAAINRGYDIAKVEGARNFCNKLWNIARYIEGKTDGQETPKTPPQPQTIADHWVLNVLQHSSDKIGKGLEVYNFAESYETLYHTVWDDVADWYIEASKSQQGSGPMLNYVLETILRLAHPFAPFVTEAIWQTLPISQNGPLATSKWPSGLSSDAKYTKDFEHIKKLVTEVRQITKALNLKKPTLTFTTSSLLSENADLIKQLASLGEIIQSGSSSGVRLLRAQAWLEVEESKIKEYQGEVTEKIQAQKGTIANFNKRLANKSYVDNAPKHIVEETMHSRSKAESELSLLEAELKRFS